MINNFINNDWTKAILVLLVVVLSISYGYFFHYKTDTAMYSRMTLDILSSEEYSKCTHLYKENGNYFISDVGRNFIIKNESKYLMDLPKSK